MQPFHKQAESLIEKEFIFHFRTSRPEITVAVLYTKDGRWVSAASVCSSKDQFCKKIGKAIARGRAEKSLARGDNCHKFTDIWNADFISGSDKLSEKAMAIATLTAAGARLAGL